MKISAIVAMSTNQVIGKQNRLPWHIPEDLKHFRLVTTGHPIIMGRRTYESIGRTLPNRTNIIVSRQPQYQVPGGFVFPSIEDAFQFCRDSDLNEEVFVVGGSEIYRLTFSALDRIYLTLIHQEVEGDAHFPQSLSQLLTSGFQEIHREDRTHPFSFSFLTLERKKAFTSR